MEDQTSIVVSGETTQTVKETVQPIVVFHGNIQTQEDNCQLAVNFEKGVIGIGKSALMKGAIMSVKEGQNLNHYPLEGNSKEEFAENCKRAAKAFINTQIVRGFGYNRFKGMKVPRIELNVDGTGKKFSIPKIEEGQSEASYFAKHKPTLEKMVGEITEMLQSGAVNLDKFLLS